MCSSDLGQWQEIGHRETPLLQKGEQLLSHRTGGAEHGHLQGPPGQSGLGRLRGGKKRGGQWKERGIEGGVGSAEWMLKEADDWSGAGGRAWCWAGDWDGAAAKAMPG